MNCTGNGVRPDVWSAVNDATGAGTGAGGGVGGVGGVAAVMDLVIGPLAPTSLLDVSVTVYVPAAAKVCDGFCAVEVAPSPKFHDQLLGEPLEVSVNCTANGALPDSGDAVNDALGAVGATMAGHWPPRQLCR